MHKYIVLLFELQLDASQRHRRRQHQSKSQQAATNGGTLTGMTMTTTVRVDGTTSALPSPRSRRATPVNASWGLPIVGLLLPRGLPNRANLTEHVIYPNPYSFRHSFFVLWTMSTISFFLFPLFRVLPLLQSLE